jgi:hypothetical protein
VTPNTGDRIDPDEFVRIWQQSASLTEVAQKTGWPRASCYSRANYYRRNGVPLQKFRRTSRIASWKKLAELAETLERPA